MASAAFLQEAAQAYHEACRVCAAKLERIHRELCLTEQEASDELARVHAAALSTWEGAVHDAEQQLASIEQRVEAAWREVQSIQAELGEMQEAHTTSPAGSSMREALEMAIAQLTIWRQKRAQVQRESDAVQAANAALRQQLGLPQSHSKVDLSRAGFEFLNLEQQRLMAKQEERMTQLRDEMAKLMEVGYVVLGEDVARIAAEVHPSLRHYASSSDGATGSDLLQQCTVDLSASTLDTLAVRARELQALRVERQAQLQQLQDVLTSLWTAVGTPDDAPERASLTLIMSGPGRLYKANIDKLAAEVHRLEDCRAQAMRDLVLSKARELQAVCRSSHMQVPALELILEECGLNRQRDVAGLPLTPGTATTGQISDSLGKVLRLLGDRQREAERRRPLVDALEDMQMSRAEAAWLNDYEKDANRFKGRDANSNLHRSIRAQKHREVLPQMLDNVQQMLESWQLTEGSPFLYNDRPFMEEIQVAYEECHSWLSGKQKAYVRTINKVATSKAMGTPARQPIGRSPAYNTMPRSLMSGASVQLTCYAQGKHRAPALYESCQLTPSNYRPPRVAIGPHTVTEDRRRSGSGTPASATKKPTTPLASSATTPYPQPPRPATAIKAKQQDVFVTPDVARQQSRRHTVADSTPAERKSLALDTHQDTHHDQSQAATPQVHVAHMPSRIPRPTVN